MLVVTSCKEHSADDESSTNLTMRCIFTYRQRDKEMNMYVNIYIYGHKPCLSNGNGASSSSNLLRGENNMNIKAGNKGNTLLMESR